MAYQGKQKTVSSVSDILGFILEQSELPPEERTPVRPPETSEVQAESEYVSTLVDALAMPGTFVGEQTLSTIQSLVDPQTKIQTHQDRLGTVKIKASQLPAFFENPDEFVDKLFAGGKEISKMQRLQWAGERMKMLAGSTYAKKMKLFDGYSPEMKGIMERAVGQSAIPFKGGPPQASDITWVTQASDKIKNNGHLGQRLNSLKKKLEFGRGSQEERERIEAEIKQIEFTYKRATNFGKETGGAVNGFRSLLQQEFEFKKRGILGGRNVDNLSEKEFEEYSKTVEASNMVTLWNKYQEEADISRDITQRKNDLIKHQKALEKGDTIVFRGKKIDYSQYSTDEKKKQLLAIKREMRDLSSANRSLQRMKFWGGVGKLEGAYYGIKNTLGPGTLEAVLNRDFYDPKKGYFGRPSTEGTFYFGGAEIKFMKADNDDKGQLRVGYNDWMMKLYYSNPINRMKSLVTGERFAWKANQMEEQLKKMWGVKAGDFKDLKDPKFWSFYKKFKNLDATGQAELLAFEQYRGYAKLMSRLGRVLGDKDSNLAKKFLKAEKLYDRFEKFANRARVFSTPTRLVTNFANKTVGQAQQKIRDSVVSFLSKLKMFSGNEGAKALLNSWAAGAGGKALSGAISTAVVGFLGLAGSTIAGPLGAAISLAVSSALEKITKISIKVFIYGFIGLFAVFMVLPGILGTSKKKSRIDAYSREIPGEIYYEESFDSYGNTDFSGTNDGSYEDPNEPNDGWEGDSDAPEIPNECVEGESLQDVYSQAKSYVASQYGTVTVPLIFVYPGDEWYEFMSVGIWCYSTPGGIYCKGDKLAASSCGYAHNLLVHELLHQLQGDCSREMAEWGADYLSNNAGGYFFQTSQGCIRATELSTSKCTPEEKINAALCKNTGNSCFQEISGKISGFCRP